MKTMTRINMALIALAIGTSSVLAAKKNEEPPAPLSTAGQKLEKHFTGMRDKLRTELIARIPRNDATADTLNKFIASDALDAKLVEFVVEGAAV